jgi:hypothetical protein
MSKTASIITGGSWILKKIAMSVCEALTVSGWGCEVGGKELLHKGQDLTYFVNYALSYGLGLGDGVNVGYFTHREDGLTEEWEYAEKKLDAGVYIADRYKPNMGSLAKIYPTGHKLERDEKLRVGICGRMYESGRKGQDRLVELDEMISGVRWCFMGSGWDTLELNNDFEVTEWKNKEQAEKWWRSLDVFLSLSHLEGGSIPHVEAVKYGVPYRYSFDVGNSEVWGSSFRIVDNVSDLYEHFHTLVISFGALHTFYKGWEDFGAKHVDYFNRLLV